MLLKFREQIVSCYAVA